MASWIDPLLRQCSALSSQWLRLGGKEWRMRNEDPKGHKMTLTITKESFCTDILFTKEDVRLEKKNFTSGRTKILRIFARQETFFCATHSVFAINHWCSYIDVFLRGSSCQQERSLIMPHNSVTTREIQSSLEAIFRWTPEEKTLS